MRRIGRLMGMCSALALAGAVPALAQPLTVQLREQPRDSVSDDADYQWIDDADALLDAIGDAPPDFSFSYDRTAIWGWRTGTGHEIYAEPLGGTIRYYYFEPGSREPFLVQDQDYAFGYRPGGRLIVVYDRDGRLLSRSEGDREAGQADWLYRRGRAIHASAQNDRGWDSVDAGYWAEQLPIILDLRLRWSSGRDRHPGWRRWHGHSGATKWREPLAGERQRRWSASDRFRRWQQGGFRGPPPRFGDGTQIPSPGVRPPRPGWRPGLTRPQTPDGTPGTRPPRPGGRPGWVRPPVDSPPGGEPPLRPDRPGWVRPGPSIIGAPPVVDTPIDNTPDVDRPQRPGRPNWTRPRQPDSDPGPGPRPPRFERPPATPSPGITPDRPVPGERPHWRPDGGQRPGAGAERPEPPRVRPDRPIFTRPPGFAPVERPHYSPPPRVEPAERPQFTPRPTPPQPSYVAPAPPPAPPPPPPPPPPPADRVMDRVLDQPQ